MKSEIFLSSFFLFFCAVFRLKACFLINGNIKNQKMLAHFLLFFLGIFRSYCTIPHRCGQSRFNDFSHIKDNNISEYVSIGRKLQRQTVGPIKIHFDYSALRGDATQNQIKMIQKFLPKAQRLLSERVSVLKTGLKLRFSTSDCFSVFT